MIGTTSYRGVASKPYSLSTLPWRGRRLITPGNLARETNFQVLHYDKDHRRDSPISGRGSPR